VQDQDILDSWKEIAAYLKKPERTCRRWEKEFGLPVHRMDALPKAHIFAYKHELDKWIHEKLDSADAQKKGAIIRNRLKKPAIAVIMILILCSVGVLLWQIFLRKGPSATSLRPNSVAVLPFIDLSPQKDHEWFSDGLSDDLITALSSLKGLRVPARTSSFFFKGKELDIQEIGRKLNVEDVPDGSVQVAGDMLRVNAQLISVKDGCHLWSDQFDRRLEDVFSIRDEIAREIVKALKVRLLGEEEAHLTKRYTKNLEAYNLYLKGSYFWNKFTTEGFKKARDYYEKAIEADPEYAVAYVGLAESYIQLGVEVAGSLSPRETYPLAKRAVERALEIDETLGEAHTTLGFLKLYYDRDLLGAEVEFKRGLELSPNSAATHDEYSVYLANTGRLEEAIVEVKRSLELDPLLIIANSDLGYCLYLAREYDQAIEQTKKTMELDPNFPLAYLNLGSIYLQKGMIQESIAVLEKGVVLSGEHPSYKAELGIAYAMADRRGEALTILAELMQLPETGYVPAAWIARIYIGLRDYDKAFEWLDKAFEERDALLVGLKVDPFYDDIGSDPRFKVLVEKIGLEK
jgi:TolB-like protein/Tfp pilus assembly protein PilF